MCRARSGSGEPSDFSLYVEGVRKCRYMMERGAGKGGERWGVPSNVRLCWVEREGRERTEKENRRSVWTGWRGQTGDTQHLRVEMNVS